MEPPEFSSFQEYQHYLSDGLRRITRNASSSARKVRYVPLATISSGYDSTGCAALAAAAGCREAVTFRTARSGPKDDKGPFDSGRSIGEQLGMTVQEFDREAYLERDGFPEAEFVVCGDLGQDLACGDLGQELPWKVFSGVFERRLVVDGTHGDVVWDRHRRPSKKGITKKGPGGGAMVEFRSRVGFLHVLPAFFGSWSHPSIYLISNSAEMNPWRMGGRYDRPIPRRIAEEKGVSRESFGQRKKAATVLLNRDASLDRFMKPESRADFERFYQQQRRVRPRFPQAVHSVLFAIRMWHLSLVRSLRLSRFVPCPVPAKYRMPPGRPSFLVHWAMPIIQKRYQKARMTGDASAAG